MAQKKNSDTTATLPLRVMTVLESTADDMVGASFDLRCFRNGGAKHLFIYFNKQHEK